MIINSTIVNNPTGSLSITSNGTYDVTDKASAVVNVWGTELCVASNKVITNSSGDANETVTITIN